MGHLSAAGVLIAGALGGSAGDQFFFYASRGRLRRWLGRFPRLAARQELVAARVRQHALGMMLACRFLPGLRIAIPVACAYAEVPAVRFSTCSLMGGIGWAAAILLVVAQLGPRIFEDLGLGGRWTPVVAGVLVLGFLAWVGRSIRGSGAERNKPDRPDQ